MIGIVAPDYTRSDKLSQAQQVRLNLYSQKEGMFSSLSANEESESLIDPLNYSLEEEIKENLNKLRP